MTALLSLFAVTLASACDDEDAAMLEPAYVPERQFVFEDALFEHRQEGKLVWVARAKKTDGDLASANAFDVHMKREPQAADQDAYDIVSPTAKLDFDNGKADFEDVRITDAGGGLITAGNAHYDESVSRIDVDGPVTFSAKGLVADATKGFIDLNTGTMNVIGPVQGRFNPAETTPAKAHPESPAPRPP